MEITTIITAAGHGASWAALALVAVAPFASRVVVPSCVRVLDVRPKSTPTTDGGFPRTDVLRSCRPLAP